MSLEYIDQLEEQLPGVLADDGIRAMILRQAIGVYRQWWLEANPFLAKIG